MTWRFCVTCEEPELLTDIRDFTSILRDFQMQFLRMVRVIYQEWLGMQFAIWSLDLAIRNFTFFKHRF